MIKSFDEWFGEASQNKLFWESPSKASKMGFEAGKQSKQAEIDELQKRVDKAVEHIEDYYGVVGLSVVVDILKGEEN